MGRGTPIRGTIDRVPSGFFITFTNFKRTIRYGFLEVNEVLSLYRTTMGTVND